MKTVVIGLHQYLDRETFLSDRYMTFKDIRAFFREGVMRVFSPNLSAIAVTTCLDALGYDIQYVDLAFEFGIPFTKAKRAERDGKLALYLALHRFDNVFIPCVSSAEHLELVAVARIVREVLPGAVIGVGSYHANTLRETLLHLVPQIDFIFLGDLEPKAKDLMERLRSRDPGALADMENAIVRVDGKICSRPYHSVADEGESRFDYRVCRRYLRYYDCLASLGTKGCPFTCAFCQEKFVRRGYFLRSPGGVVEEARQNLALYREECGGRGIPHGFMDPIFGLNRKWTADFCGELARRPLGVPWGFQTRVGQLEPEEYAMVAESGCAVIYHGLETFSREMLRQMNKTPDPEHYLVLFQRDIANATKRHIQLETNILFGFPGETKATLDENRRGIAAMKAQMPNASFNLNLYRPLPDTQILVERNAGRGSRLLVKDWWEKGVVPGVTITVQPSDDLTAPDLLEFFAEMYADDSCYERRGVSSQMETYFQEGGMTPEELEFIGNRSRSRQQTFADSFCNCAAGI